MNNYKYFAPIVLSILCSISHAEVDCEKAFAEIMSKGDPMDIKRRIIGLEGLSADCGGSGIFEARLAKLYELNGDYKKSEKLLRNAIEKNYSHRKEVYSILFDTLFIQEKIDASNEIASLLAKEYPSWDGGFIKLGQIGIAKGEYHYAVDNLIKAINNKESSSAYLLLVLAYYQLEMYRETGASMQKALRLDSDAIYHTDAVLCTAFSLIRLGYIKESEELLLKHQELRPEVSSNKSFIEAISVIGNIKKQASN